MHSGDIEFSQETVYIKFGQKWYDTQVKSRKPNSLIIVFNFKDFIVNPWKLAPLKDHLNALIVRMLVFLEGLLRALIFKGLRYVIKMKFVFKIKL